MSQEEITRLRAEIRAEREKQKRATDSIFNLRTKITRSESRERSLKWQLEEKLKQRDAERAAKKGVRRAT